MSAPLLSVIDAVTISIAYSSITKARRSPVLHISLNSPQLLPESAAASISLVILIHHVCNELNVYQAEELSFYD